MPQYMLLVYESSDFRPTPEQLAETYPKWMAYTEELRASGAWLAGDALERIDTATTLRVRDGETLVSDGPFAETKEVLGGYYLIDVPDLDEALKWSARMPGAFYGSVEVRPVRSMG